MTTIPPEARDSQLRIAVLPLDIAYADPEANIAAVEAARIDAGTDLLVLPELFSTGFIKNPEKQARLAQGNDGPAMTRLRRMASERSMAIAGSFLAGEPGGPYFNRAFLILPDGTAAFYDKHHLFTYSGENKVLAAGSAPSPVVSFRGWRIKMMVCYDLRFPLWCRNVEQEYDLMLFPANWPAEREYAFRQLLIARAIENQAVTVGANRGGEDRWGTYPPSMCQIIDYKGRPVGEVSNGIVYATLNRASLDRYRTNFPVYLDADPFTLTR